MLKKDCICIEKSALGHESRCINNMKSVEQSKTPKEEQAEHIHWTCGKCAPSCCYPFCKVYVGEPKTEDTGECKNCNGKGYNTVFTGIRISPDFIGDVEYNEKPKINKVPCRICKGTGVSKEATTKDSCDTLSPSENKEESMEDRFEKKWIRDDGLLGIGKYDHEEILSFIEEEISKAVAKERESIKRQIKKKMDSLYAQRLECGNEFKELLSLLNSKKGKE